MEVLNNCKTLVYLSFKVTLLDNCQLSLWVQLAKTRCNLWLMRKMRKNANAKCLLCKLTNQLHSPHNGMRF